jgi:hypothetical protein
VVCALAVLLGLFGMHGLATAQAGGCHADDGMISALSMSPSMSASMTPSMAAGSPARDTGDAVVTAHRMAGAGCLFVSPTAWPALALVLLALVVAAIWWGEGRSWAAWMSGRSPPRTGVSLLRWVCVSRT